MLSFVSARARRLVQAGLAALAMGAFTVPALAWNTTQGGPTSQNVKIGQQGATVVVTYVADLGDDWGAGTITWSVINAVGANVDTTFGNPCVPSSVDVGPNYASSACQFKVTTATGSFQLRAASNVPGTSPAVFNVTVVPPTISLNDVTSAEGNSGTQTQTFTASLDAPAGPGGVSFTIATADGNATTADGDYVARNLTGQTIPAGASTYTFGVTVNGDTKYEQNESYFVNLNSVTGATVGDGQGEGAINNDDAAPTLSINDVSVTEGNSGTTNLAFTVTKTGSTALTATVNYATANGTATTADNDYVAASGTLTFLAGETTKTINVTVNGDTDVETNETLAVNLSGATNATISDAQGQGTINNDDATPFVSINSVSSAEGNSGTAVQTFTVSLDQASSQTVTVAYGTNDGTATVLDNDYEALSGQLTFTPGQTTKTLSVPVNGDTKYEANEQYTMVLSSPTNAALGTATGTGTITNDDAAPTISVTDVSLNEGNSGTTNFPFVIALSNASYQSITVTYSTANDTAVSPGDFTSASGSVTFAPGETSKAANIAVIGDTAIEPNEAFFFNLTAATGATIDDGVAVGTIQNDDVPVNITTLTLPNGTAGANYANTVSTSGGLAPIGFSVAVGPLPPGLSLNTSNGLISGTPTQAGTFTFSINAADSNTPQTNDTQSYTVTIAGPTIALSPTTLSNGAVGTAYSQTVTATGGIAPYSFAVTAGTFPAGLVLGTASGIIFGTPTQAGTFNFTVTTTDETTGTGAPFSGSRNYTLTIGAPTITLGSLANGTAGAPYSQSAAATGGTAPYSYAVTGGTLPAGLVLGTASGIVSGTPTAAGSFNFTISATDESTGAGAPFTGARAYTVSIAAPTLALSPAAGALPATQAGVAYSQTFSTTGGTAPYTYAVIAGTLPAGLTLNPTTGTLSGTATAAGTFNFVVRAQDSTSGAGSPFAFAANYSLTVNAPTIVLNPTTLPNATQFSSYNQPITATGGTAPYTFSVTSGALPAGLTLDPATGALSGTPTVYGSFNFTIAASDTTSGGSFSGGRAYTLGVNQAPPTVSTIAPSSGPTAGGQSVAITGANFYAVTSVTFGGTSAAYTVNSPTSISVTTPAHAEGPVNVVIVAGGGTVTATNGYTYIAPGLVRFVVNNPDDGSYVFTSPTAALNFTVATSGGSGQSANISLAPGSYSLSFTAPTGAGIASASCAPSPSTINPVARTASLTIVSNVTTVCTIDAVPAQRVTVETLGAALQTGSALIISNAPSLSRRLDRLNGREAGQGTASAFGKTLASGLPFSADIGADQIRFSASLSGLRRLTGESHSFAPANDNGVPASLAASAAPASGLAATAAADAAASMTDRAGPRFDVWVEGLLAEFDAAANADGHFAIVHAGADYLVTPDLLVGVGLQGDWLDMGTATGDVNSRGWLAGPYATLRLAPNLYLDARAAWGGATFQVSPFGTYTDKVSSDRTLYSAALIGEFVLGDLTIRPEGRVTWYNETTEAYVDSLSVFIPSVEIKTGEVSLGPDFEWTLKQANGGVFVPRIGFDLIWTFQQDNTATAFTNAPGLDDTGVRGRVEAGLAFVDARGVEVSGGMFYDGIGGGDYSAWGGTLKLRFGF